MGKRSRKRFSSDCHDELTKRSKMSATDPVTVADAIKIEETDIVERKVELLVMDAANNTHRTLTIFGAGLGIEKTVAVVEEMKRHYTKNNTNYSQETFIKAGANNEPQLQVILTLRGSDTS